MNELKLIVDSTQDLSWLPQAISEVANASEADLEAMRAKKWYASLWETITFSSDNETRIANGVSNLAKLQDILVRVMVMLSDTDDMLSEQVKEHDAELAKLAEFDTQLLQALKKHIYGKHEGLELSDVSNEKQKLLVDLVVAADVDAEKNDLSRRYISAIMRAVGILNVDSSVRVTAIESLNVKEQELLYRLILTNRCLLGMDFDMESDVLDEISISPKKRRDIQVSIKDTAANTGTDFFASVFENSKYEYDLLDDIGIQFIDDNKDTSKDDYIIDDMGPYEEIIISSIMHIKPGEVQVFRHKIIHHQSMVHCEGSLEFYDCQIHYGEKEVQDEISFSGNGSFVMKYCTVEAHSFDENCFISINERASEVVFENCKFINCCSFLHTRASFSMVNCSAENIGGHFIDGYNITGTIYKSHFQFGPEPDFIKKSYRYNDLIDVSQCKEKEGLTISQCTFTGNLHIDEHTEEAFQNSDDSFRDHDIIDGDYTVDQCIFAGIYRIFGDSGNITNSLFKHCYRVVDGQSIRFGDAGRLAGCLFESCCNIGRQVGRNYHIIHCKFNSCFGELISSFYLYGGVRIEWCDFDSWRESEWSTPVDDTFNHPVLGEYRANALISLLCPKDKKSPNYIRNCTFSNITLNQCHLIKGYAFEKLPDCVGYIRDCSLVNCTRGSKKYELITEWGTYRNLFNKEKLQRIIYIGGNCRGFDQ